MATAGVGLQGLWVELLTPLTEDLLVHHSKLSTHVQTLGAKGVQGVVMFSHVGEGDSFNAAERLDAGKQLMAHGIARDEAEAARKAIAAGVDIDMMGFVYSRHLAAEVRAGRRAHR